jgi:hypothetical protein
MNLEDKALVNNRFSVDSLNFGGLLDIEDQLEFSVHAGSVSLFMTATIVLFRRELVLQY